MKASDIPDGWLTAKEAADLLGVSESVILKDLRANALERLDRGAKRRPRWLASRDAVMAMVHAGGRPDRRATPQRNPRSAPIPRAFEDAALRQSLDEAQRTIARLRQDVERLKLVARNANVAAQAQTDSLQQFLIEDAARQTE